MCVDVYLDILPAAKTLFVCVKRLLRSVSATALDVTLSRVAALSRVLPKFGTHAPPGMNISFVLDGVMGEADGLRPLDWHAFRANDARQPLRVASSYVQDGKLRTKCFGRKNFFPGHAEFVRRADGRRHGLYACLEASMTVPGAAGDPVRMVDNRRGGGSDNDDNDVDNKERRGVPFFDAFCFEPLPYRSAVAEGATHVLVLCSRPEGFQPKTVPGVYERGVASMYFQSHGEPRVAEFFERGGQQYIYAEDLLTLEEGKRAGLLPQPPQHSGAAHVAGGIRVPPPEILYGVDRDERALATATNRANWRQAHLFPLKVPIGTKELPSLEQNRDAVGEAVREGFAAAFDLLAPAIGLELDEGLTGMEVARILFPPDEAVSESVLKRQLRVKGDVIPSAGVDHSLGRARRRKRDVVLPLLGIRRSEVRHVNEAVDGNPVESQSRAEHLLRSLPGFASGRMAHLALGLRTRTT